MNPVKVLVNTAKVVTLASIGLGVAMIGMLISMWPKSK